MSPESSAILSPGIDAGPGDFELAGQLYSAVLYRDSGVCADSIAALFRCAVGSPQALFCADGLPATLPAPWFELFADAARCGTLTRRRGVAADSEYLALALVFGEETLGFIGVGQHGIYATGALRRFADFASLLAGLLHSRRAYDQRVAALTHSEIELRRQSQMLAQIRDSVITMDSAGHITGWNAGAERMFGYATDEVLGQHLLLLYADEAEDDHAFNLCFENGSHEMTVRRRRKSGEIFWASVSLSLARDENGNACGMIGYVIDISGQLAAEEELRLHARIFEQNSEAIIVTDAVGAVVSVNQAFTRLTGFAADRIGGRPIAELLAAEDALRSADIARHVGGGEVWRGELQIRKSDGSSFPGCVSISSTAAADSDSRHLCIVFSDISERRAAAREIERLAFFDATTGLPNRTLFFSLLQQTLANARRVQAHGAVLLLNLDRFKNINDSFGHAAADALLRKVSRRLSVCLREEDVVARLGGDEFVILLPSIARREHAGHVAQKLLAAIGEAFQLEQHEILLSASIGISIFPEDESDSEALLNCADVAMHRAKRAGNGIHVFYSQEMNQRSLELLKLESDLRRAVERNELSLHFQPQLALANGSIRGAEVLLRWNRPGVGPVSPAQFIPVAEETGLIASIGEWVIDATCRQIAAWRAAGLPPVRFAVNLSARQFSANLPQAILNTLARYAVPADALELEITESMLMSGTEEVLVMMQELGDAGIHLSLDDFGTGYSSLSYLKRLPIDTLKIDRSFVHGIPDDADNSEIARAIIGLAKNLRLTVIAEGVETVEQLAFLEAAGCDEIQGFYFSRPLPADEFAALLRRHSV
ncbi:putative bifunctional diguanylate cyclase/phosphodiesterase [Rhodocyclus tenuis]|uniref:putative bifunctional diguanylate cyclase/phosphodiesterase n=1 Tax=Rhodocyclus tenuis TaxID=1066 RepID=UPI001907F310|nr:EAL domain-containing protein [Rhodocyclus tenuis]